MSVIDIHKTSTLYTCTSLSEAIARTSDKTIDSTGLLHALDRFTVTFREELANGVSGTVTDLKSGDANSDPSGIIAFLESGVGAEGVIAALQWSLCNYIQSLSDDLFWPGDKDFRCHIVRKIFTMSECTSSELCSAAVSSSPLSSAEQHQRSFNGLWGPQLCVAFRKLQLQCLTEILAAERRMLAASEQCSPAKSPTLIHPKPIDTSVAGTAGTATSKVHQTLSQHQDTTSKHGTTKLLAEKKPDAGVAAKKELKPPVPLLSDRAVKLKEQGKSDKDKTSAATTNATPPPEPFSAEALAPSPSLERRFSTGSGSESPQRIINEDATTRSLCENIEIAAARLIPFQLWWYFRDAADAPSCSSCGLWPTYDRLSCLHDLDTVCIDCVRSHPACSHSMVRVKGKPAHRVTMSLERVQINAERFIPNVCEGCNQFVPCVDADLNPSYMMHVACCKSCKELIPKRFSKRKRGIEISKKSTTASFASNNNDEIIDPTEVDVEGEVEDDDEDNYCVDCPHVGKCPVCGMAQCDGDCMDSSSSDCMQYDKLREPIVLCWACCEAQYEGCGVKPIVTIAMHNEVPSSVRARYARRFKDAGVASGTEVYTAVPEAVTGKPPAPPPRRREDSITVGGEGVVMNTPSPATPSPIPAAPSTSTSKRPPLSPSTTQPRLVRDVVQSIPSGRLLTPKGNQTPRSPQDPDDTRHFLPPMTTFSPATVGTLVGSRDRCKMDNNNFFYYFQAYITRTSGGAWGAASARSQSPTSASQNGSNSVSSTPLQSTYMLEKNVFTRLYQSRKRSPVVPIQPEPSRSRLSSHQMYVKQQQQQQHEEIALRKAQLETVSRAPIPKAISAAAPAIAPAQLMQQRHSDLVRTFDDSSDVEVGGRGGIEASASAASNGMVTWEADLHVSSIPSTVAHRHTDPNPPNAKTAALMRSAEPYQSTPTYQSAHHKSGHALAIRHSVCDRCGVHIEQAFYRSLMVADFDLCAECFERRTPWEWEAELHSGFLRVPTNCDGQTFLLTQRTIETDDYLRNEVKAHRGEDEDVFVRGTSEFVEEAPETQTVRNDSSSTHDSGTKSGFRKPMACDVIGGINDSKTLNLEYRDGGRVMYGRRQTSDIGPKTMASIPKKVNGFKSTINIKTLFLQRQISAGSATSTGSFTGYDSALPDSGLRNPPFLARAGSNEALKRGANIHANTTQNLNSAGGTMVLASALTSALVATVDVMNEWCGAGEDDVLATSRGKEDMAVAVALRALAVVGKGLSNKNDEIGTTTGLVDSNVAKTIVSPVTAVAPPTALASLQRPNLASGSVALAANKVPSVYAINRYFTPIDQLSSQTHWKTVWKGVSKSTGATLIEYLVLDPYRGTEVTKWLMSAAVAASLASSMSVNRKADDSEAEKERTSSSSTLSRATTTEEMNRRSSTLGSYEAPATITNNLTRMERKLSMDALCNNTGSFGSVPALEKSLTDSTAARLTAAESPTASLKQIVAVLSSATKEQSRLIREKFKNLKVDSVVMTATNSNNYAFPSATAAAHPQPQRSKDYCVCIHSAQTLVSDDGKRRAMMCNYYPAGSFKRIGAETFGFWVALSKISECMATVSAALAKLHSEGICHGRIRYSQVFLDSERSILGPTYHHFCLAQCAVPPQFQFPLVNFAMSYQSHEQKTNINPAIIGSGNSRLFMAKKYEEKQLKNLVSGVTKAVFTPVPPQFFPLRVASDTGALAGSGPNAQLTRSIVDMFNAESGKANMQRDQLNFEAGGHHQQTEGTSVGSPKNGNSPIKVKKPSSKHAPPPTTSAAKGNIDELSSSFNHSISAFSPVYHQYSPALTAALVSYRAAMTRIFLDNVHYLAPEIAQQLVIYLETESRLERDGGGDSKSATTFKSTTVGETKLQQELAVSQLFSNSCSIGSASSLEGISAATATSSTSKRLPACPFPEPTPEADIYALGCFLLTLHTSRSPQSSWMQGEVSLLKQRALDPSYGFSSVQLALNDHNLDCNLRNKIVMHMHSLTNPVPKDRPNAAKVAAFWADAHAQITQQCCGFDSVGEELLSRLQ